MNLNIVSYLYKYTVLKYNNSIICKDFFFFSKTHTNTIFSTLKTRALHFSMIIESHMKKSTFIGNTFTAVHLILKKTQFNSNNLFAKVSAFLVMLDLLLAHTNFHSFQVLWHNESNMWLVACPSLDYCLWLLTMIIHYGSFITPSRTHHLSFNTVHLIIF